MAGAGEADKQHFIQEGQARIYFTEQCPDKVFYNPVQEFNRDLSVAIIQKYLEWRSSQDQPKAQPIKLLEAFSATGLRSIRYAKEVDQLGEIVCNDISKRAVESIQLNIERNQVGHVVTASHADASQVMYEHRQPASRFDIIDLDPYGSPTAFLDAAVQSVADGGLLLVTCTDMAVLCGNAPETCYTKYGSVSLKTRCCHEMALRIVLQSIESHANRYGRYIEPLVSVSADFYCRLAVVVRSSQKMCKKSTSKLGHVFQCTGCESLSLQRLGQLIEDPASGQLKYKLTTGPPVGARCRFCDRPHHVGGPVWLAPIHQEAFVQQLVDWLKQRDASHFGTYKRMLGLVSVISEELLEVPLYYQADRLSSLLRLPVVKLTDMHSALLNAGFRVSLSHANKQAVKTDAPLSFLWTLLKAWDQRQSEPLVQTRLPIDSVAHALWTAAQPTKEQLDAVSFQPHPLANPASRSAGLTRFQVNPLPNWGPMMRARFGATAVEDGSVPKRERFQGKRSKMAKQKPQLDSLPQKKPKSNLTVDA